MRGHFTRIIFFWSFLFVYLLSLFCNTPATEAASRFEYQNKGQSITVNPGSIELRSGKIDGYMWYGDDKEYSSNHDPIYYSHVKDVYTLVTDISRYSDLTEAWDDDLSEPWLKGSVDWVKNIMTGGDGGPLDTDVNPNEIRIYESSKSHRDTRISPDGKMYIVTRQSSPTVGFIANEEWIISSITLPNTPETPPAETGSIVSKGKLWGAVYVSEDWKSEPETILKGKVGLFRDFGHYTQLVSLSGSGSGDNSRNITDTKTADGGYVYNAISLASVTGGGLREGDYILAFAHSEAGDIFGNAQADWYKQAATVEFTGSVSFTLKENSLGFGDILYKENSGLHETNSSDSTDISNVQSENKLGIFIDVSEASAIEGSFAGALNKAMNWVLSMVTKVITWGSTAIHGQLIKGNDIEVNADEQLTGKSGINEVWKDTRDMGLSLLTLALLLIAFANILNISPQQYSISRMVPRIVIAIVLTYFSYFIAAFLLDLMSALQALLFDSASQGQSFQLSTDINGAIISQTGSSAGDAASLLSRLPEILFLAILGIFVMLVIIWLYLVLIVRSAMLFILVAVAPLAFLAMILPFSEKYYKQWWGTFWKWAFIGPAVAFMLWLTQKFLQGYGASATSNFVGDPGTAWTFLIAAAVLIWLTATLPLKMGSEVYGKIKDGFDKSGKIPGLGIPKRMLDARGKNIDRRRAANDQMRMARLSQKGPIGRFATGLTSREADSRKTELLKSMGELMPESKDGLTAALSQTKAGSLEEQALIYKAIGSGNADAKDARVRDAVLRYADPSSKDFIPGLEKTLPKENGDFDVTAAKLDSRYTARGMKSLEKTLLNEYKPAHWEFAPPEHLSSIASQKTQIDAALKGKQESRKAFADKMYSSGAYSGIQDVDQFNEVVSVAGHPELRRSKEAPNPTPQPSGQPSTGSTGAPQQSATPPGVNSSNYEQRGSGLWAPKDKN